MKLCEIGEFGFIDNIARLVPTNGQGVLKGIGDDCAVVSVGGGICQLITTDMLIEGVHFRMDWISPEQLGAKALAVNLSDIAACGGRPLHAFVSLAAPDRIDVEQLERLYNGMSGLARRFDVNILGGDTNASGRDLVINVTVIGEARCSQVLYRRGARPGDAIVVTGPVGDSAAGLHVLARAPDIPDDMARPLVKAHLEPRPHIEEGLYLASCGHCSAAIDVSDGLSSDLWHICQASGVGAMIYHGQLPMSYPLRQMAVLCGKDPLDFTLRGGEDYALLAAVDKGRVAEVVQQAAKRGMQFHVIGEFVKEPGMRLTMPDGTQLNFAARGWDHFHAGDAQGKGASD
jgi:thiamine-monophosphate kinase